MKANEISPLQLLSLCQDYKLTKEETLSLIESNISSINFKEGAIFDICTFIVAKIIVGILKRNKMIK